MSVCRRKMAGEMKDRQDLNVNLNSYRKLVQSFISSHQYTTAVFWADKVVSLSNDVVDVFLLAQSLLFTGQYHRAAHCIQSRNLDKKHPACRYLAAKCHYESKEYQEALDILEYGSNNYPQISLPVDDHVFPLRNVDSCTKLLKGKVYEAMDNRSLAVDCFKEALADDVYCYEAFQALVQHQMLSADEELELLEMLPFEKQCSLGDNQLVPFLYENKLKKYSKPTKKCSIRPVEYLSSNSDVMVGQAERLYYDCDYQECFKMTSLILERDLYHIDCLPIHVACLVELKKSINLFQLAHKLVDLYPDSAVSWFAVGCYYLLIGKNDQSRRYLSKSTTLDRVFAPAWLAYGHSFAVENEHDQAMAAYFKASKLMKGCHLPLLYIGLEYGLTNNSKLAEKFFNQALSIAPEDPFVLHEIGVIAFQNQDYKTAERHFLDALEKVQSSCQTVMTERWEPLLNNLAHVCRKLKKYEDALAFHQQALTLAPHNPSTLSAIGHVHALIGNSSQAVDYFHKALGLRRDDTFSTTMLTNVIDQLMSEISACEGAPDSVPPFPVSSDESDNMGNSSTLQSGDSIGLSFDMEIAD